VLEAPVLGDADGAPVSLPGSRALLSELASTTAIGGELDGLADDTTHLAARTRDGHRTQVEGEVLCCSATAVGAAEVQERGSGSTGADLVTPRIGGPILSG
jgi:hypothetical protein